jgi:PAS domain S-box-containing protein
MKSEKSPTTILLIDDKVANLVALQNLLDTPDRSFLQATSGSEALKLAFNRNIDLIILDVQMPIMDGFEVAKYLRSNTKTKDIPIMFASAEKKEYHSMMKGFEEGAIDYLFKPLDPEITRAKVSVLLKIQLQKKELIEKNLALSRSQLLINNSADIIGMIDRPSLKLVEINNAFTSILGFSKDEALGVQLAFFLDEDARSLLRELNDDKKERLSFETKVYTKDRHVKWLHWNVVVKGNRWYFNARDITEVKEVERIRMYLATVVKQSSDAIYIHDNEGRIISWNDGAEKMYGYRESEALKMKVWNIIPPYLMPETQDVIDKVLAGEKIEVLETKRVSRHGKLVDVLFSASCIADARTSQRSIAITERDVTQQKIANEQIKQLNADLRQNNLQLNETNKELESFSYSVSHDLRAPLRAMNGYARILDEDYLDKLDDEGKTVLTKLRNNVRKMNQLIDDLLAFSKLGQKELRKSMTEMDPLVQEVLSEINHSTKHGAHISVAPLPVVFGDRALMFQVWHNLISNGIKYSSKKDTPQIQIGCTSSDDQNVFYVEDNGAGFDYKFADRLFGTFQRLHSTAEFEGTGIGLAIVKRIVSKHGGNIWAESVVGQGAKFYFSLPKPQNNTPQASD